MGLVISPRSLYNVSDRLLQKIKISLKEQDTT